MVILLLLLTGLEAARIAYNKIPKTEDHGAPLFLQDGSKKNHILKLFLEKYGMTGTKKAKSNKKNKKNKKSGANSSSGKGDSGDEGWVYGVINTGSECSGTVYMQAGIKLGKCIPMSSSESFYFTCDDGYVTMSTYTDESCADLEESVYVVETGCSTTTTWYTDDESSENSIQVTCTTNYDMPYEAEDNVEYDLLNIYASSSSSSCASDDLILYEAYPTDTCIPMNYSEYGYSSIEFEISNLDDDKVEDVPYLKYFTSSKVCSGTAKTSYLSSTCASLYSGYDVYYKWATFAN